MSVLLAKYIRNGAWLDAQDFPALRWAVPGLMPEGFGLLTGGPKLGKSWFVMGCCLAVSSDRTALGCIATGPPRPVLYMSLEDGPRRLKDRRAKLLGDEPTPDLFHFPEISPPPADVLPIIEGWLDEHGDRAPMVVLDTLGRVMPPALPGESAYQRDYRIGVRLKAIADAHPGSTIVVVHHIRKQSGEDWMDSTSGTNGLNGAADWTLNLSRPRNETRGLLRITGRDVIEGEYAVTCESGCWQLDGDDLKSASEAAMHRQLTDGVSDRSAEMLKILAKHPDGIGPTAMGKAMDMPAKHAGTYLLRLVDQGRARKVGTGRYTGVESVEVVEVPGQDTFDVSTEDTSCGTQSAPLTSEFHSSTLSTPVRTCACGAPIGELRAVMFEDCVTCHDRAHGIERSA